MHNREMAVVDALFEQARRKLAQANSASAEPGATPVFVVAAEEDIRAAALAWFHTQERKSAAEDRAGLHPASGASSPDPDDMLATLGIDEAALEGERGRQWAEKAARDALARYGFTLPQGELRALAADLMQRAALETVRRSVRRWSGAVGETSHDADFVGITAVSPAPPAPQLPGLTFGALCDAYLAAPERANHSPKTKLKDAGSLRLIREILGAEKAAASITRDDCQKLRVTLSALPANMAQRYPKMPVAKVVDLAKRDGALLVAPKTVVHHLNLLAAVFNWGVREARLPASFGNPARGMKASTAKNLTAAQSGERRRPFTLAELKAIFSQPVYVGCQDDEAGYATPGPNRPRRGRYWVPLLALFAGLRLNEACQLRTGDVEEVDGVALIYVRATAEDQRLKTSAAERRIPVHPELVRLGFLDFVRAQRAKGEARLFPDLLPSRQGIYSDPFSKWFGRYLTKAGITSKGAVFHSFRHAFRDAMREAAVPREVADFMFGHADSGQAATYGAGFSARVLADHVARIAYPGLDLMHLHPATENGDA